MKPVIGLLLIGGGITLLYGLFTGKINFPGFGTAPASSSSANTGYGNLGAPGGQPVPKAISVTTPGMGSPSGGAKTCPPGYTLRNGYCVPVVNSRL